MPAFGVQQYVDRQIVPAYPQADFIFLIVDGASIYKSKSTLAWLKERPRIVLVPLPSYAPKLNLQEIGYTQYSSGRMGQRTRLPTWQQVIGSMDRSGIRQVTAPPAIPTGGPAACVGSRGGRF